MDFLFVGCDAVTLRGLGVRKGEFGLRNIVVLCRCILVDENDNVVGHDSKYNCAFLFLSSRAFLFITKWRYVLLLGIEKLAPGVCMQVI